MPHWWDLYRMPQWAPGEGSCPSCRYRDVTHIPDRSGACATQPKIWALTGALEMNGIYVPNGSLLATYFSPGPGAGAYESEGSIGGETVPWRGVERRDSSLNCYLISCLHQIRALSIRFRL
uniref:Uncharacterized protein n=1 Tax=Xenopus tropicalis TaxID=8364 RepID=A0A1B8Y3F6_XENTR